MIVRNTGYSSQMMVNDILSQQSKLYETYDKVTSTKKFTNISENPVDSSTIIGINQQMEKIEAYLKNVGTVKTTLSEQDSIFSTVIEKMNRINELSIQAANGASGTSGITAAQAEIEELKKSVVSLANTKYNDMYIFAGANITTPPYAYDEETGAITYNGTSVDDPSFERELDIADGMKVGLNAAGDGIFGAYDPDNPDDPDKSFGLFKVLGDLSKALDSQDGNEIREQLDNIQNSIKHVSETQSIFGAKISKINMTETNHSNTKLVLESRKQNLQEVDQVQAISDFVKQNYAYQASMQVFMQMQNNSLLNYM